ncbi:hypothetical protein RSAG8_06804, partial [Rhizoctonia solani AG-8 WAC10335]
MSQIYLHNCYNRYRRVIQVRVPRDVRKPRKPRSACRNFPWLISGCPGCLLPAKPGFHVRKIDASPQPPTRVDVRKRRTPPPQ